MSTLTPRDKTGIRILAACLISVLTLMGLALLADDRGSGTVDPDTGCALGVFPSRSTVIMLDPTDGISSQQLRHVRTRVREVAVGAKRGDKVSVHVLRGEDQAVIDEVFSKCSPPNPVDANPMYQNERLIRKRFNEGFLEPLLDAIENKAAVGVASSSPILEWIQAVSELREFSGAVSERKLLIVSDMLQNTSTCSHYGKTDYQECGSRAPHAPEATPDLSGVDVEVVYLRRVGPYQTPSHIAFWKRFFGEAGVTNPEITKR